MPQQLLGWRRDARSQSENGAGKGGIGFTPVIVDAGPRADMPIAPACPGAGWPLWNQYFKLRAVAPRYKFNHTDRERTNVSAPQDVHVRGCVLRSPE
jgi:hypothetical protein